MMSLHDLIAGAINGDNAQPENPIHTKLGEMGQKLDEHMQNSNVPNEIRTEISEMIRVVINTPAMSVKVYTILHNAMGEISSIEN